MSVFTPTPHIGLPDTLAEADFKNGVYSILGVPKVLTDLFTLSIFTGDETNIAVITGEGFKCEYEGTASASGQLEGTAGLFAALTPSVGFTAVIDVSSTVGGADENYGDIELVLRDNNTAHIASLQVLGEFGTPSPDGLNIVNNSGVLVHTQLAPYSNGSHRMVISFDPAGLSGAADGAAAVTTAPFDDQATADQVNIYVEAILNASMVVERVRFYPLVTSLDGLKRMSA